MAGWRRSNSGRVVVVPARAGLPVPRESEYIFGCGPREGQEGLVKIANLGMLAALGLLAALEAGAEATAGVSAADTTAPVMSVWVEQKIEFTYVGITSYYSCDGLKSKVSSILKEIGARPGFKVTVRACVNPRGGVERSPIVAIVVAMPQPATPEVLAEVARQASMSELAAKAGGKSAPTTEATAEFPARLRRVDFRESRLGPVQPGDCELIEAMRDKVFVPLGARIVEDHMACVPHQVIVGGISLAIDVLEPMPQH